MGRGRAAKRYVAAPRTTDRSPPPISGRPLLAPADVGLGVRAAAEALDLHFVPVAWEDFDIVLSGDALAAAEPLIAAVRDPVVQSSVCALGGYDVSRADAVESLT